MSRKVLLQLVLPLIGLSVLFWLLAFAPSEKHHQPPLLELSVILRDGDGAVSTMRKGMEQAAQDEGKSLSGMTLKQMETYWARAKRHEKEAKEE